MKNSGLKNEKLISELVKKGSNAITTKNQFGVHVFSGSIDTDGVLSGKLTKTKYNEEELKKSIDTNIVELIPIQVEEGPDVVLRSIYNEALQQIDELLVENENLNLEIGRLESKVGDLHATTQSLLVELDNKDLIVASAENENAQSIEKTQTTIIDLQNSIQRATSEAIKRISLTARIETLLEENRTLQDQLFRKQAELDEGAKVSKEFSLKVVNTSDEALSDLVFDARAKDDGRGNWVNGPEVEVFNFSDNTITVSFSKSGKAASALTIPQSVTLEPGKTETITIGTSQGDVDGFAPSAGFGSRGENTYAASISAESEQGSQSLDFLLRKYRGNSFG